MRPVTIGPFLAAIWLAMSPAEVASALPVPARPLRVVTAPVAPFVLPKTAPPAGFRWFSTTP
jgi:hypothetical protein